jgi:hypothetical protein
MGRMRAPPADRDLDRAYQAETSAWWWRACRMRSRSTWSPAGCCSSWRWDAGRSAEIERWAAFIGVPLIRPTTERLSGMEVSARSTPNIRLPWD